MASTARPAASSSRNGVRLNVEQAYAAILTRWRRRLGVTARQSRERPMPNQAYYEQRGLKLQHESRHTQRPFQNAKHRLARRLARLPLASIREYRDRLELTLLPACESRVPHTPTYDTDDSASPPALERGLLKCLRASENDLAFSKYC
jgi:hypothetical protein